METLSLRGARENNLKGFDLDIPHDAFVVLTGLSGSGKSSLAFETIYAEGGRRYIETFSPYTRQFLDRLHKPKLDGIAGVRPALALEQRNATVNARSTVGTVTEINDYLKVVWARAASAFCPTCDCLITRETPRHILDSIQETLSSTSNLLIVAFTVQHRGEASADSFSATLQREGFVRFFRQATGTIERLENLQDADLAASGETKNILVVVERFKAAELLEDGTDEEARRRFLASCHQAYDLGSHALHLIEFDSSDSVVKQTTFSAQLRCSSCETELPPPKASSFSYNSPIGACVECSGFGKVLRISRDRVVPNKQLSIEDGAISCWSTPSTEWEFESLLAFCEREQIPTDVPWKKLRTEQQDRIFAATKTDDDFSGIDRWFSWLERKKYKMHVRVFLSRYRAEFTCPECNGTRLKAHALQYRLNDTTLPEIWEKPVSDLLPFFQSVLQATYGDPALEPALLEIISRLTYMQDIGLEYLTLNRQSRTLSGGESQRVNLTTILGARLTNTTLVLDEPSIGLHPRDTKRLLGVIKELRDRGNSLVVVEHEQDVIRAADYVIDLGPDAGSAGGEIQFSGTPTELLETSHSHTAKHLREESAKTPPTSSRARKDFSDWLSLRGARAFNLKNIDVEIPLGGFTVVTGVSGSGKSTLVTECLIKPYERLGLGETLQSLASDPEAPISSIEGLDAIGEIVAIDQSPVGKSPRSNAATYTKAWDIIRECLASTDDAVNLGLSKSAFSFNVDGGRCPECNGAGYHKIEMQFLADVYVECEVCSGTRFTPAIQAIHFGGKSVVDFLQMTLDEAVSFFSQRGDDARAGEIVARLAPLIELGLGYLTLGQPLSKLSGGEAQRVKLASYLNADESARSVFILDEPTTGLHAHDVHNLITTLRKLVSAGHSVICIEHNTDVIKQSDWMIELGPEGGDEGGKLVASGSPRALLKQKRSIAKSYTLQALAGSLVPTESIHETDTLERGTQWPTDHITVVGARHHNLKNVTASIPKNKLSVITGMSGSGKSSLAFDIIFSEGQRRYIDCLSPYARQFIKQLQRPDVDAVASLPPTIAISQKTAARLGLSTIATTSEVYQYLRLLFAKVGTQHCPEHDEAITGFSAPEIADEIISQHSGKRIHLFAPVVSGRKGFYTDLFNRALRAEIFEARIDDSIRTIEENMRLERHKLHYISLLTASLQCNAKNRELLVEAVEQCLLLGNGAVEVSVGSKQAKPHVFSVSRMCPVCKRGFAELDPQDFSFSSKRGVCDSCGGQGVLENGELCDACDGARIKALGRHVYINAKAIHELSAMRAPELRAFLTTCTFDKRFEPIVRPIVEELDTLLRTIEAIGLDYLQLDRDTSTLSGGEAQRLRLARALGSPLTGVAYILDEPTIGLHPSDHAQLMGILQNLRDAGNTVIVVEHDEETIREADHVIDMGPTGGAQGGRIVAQGTLEDLVRSEQSPTGQAIKARSTQKSVLPAKAPSTNDWQFLTLGGAQANNLKNISVQFPINKLSVVGGVSGAGKSSLVHESLVPAIFSAFNDPVHEDRTWEDLHGHESFERFVEIDQSPLGRSPSSCPGSYLKVFDDIRNVFAGVPEAGSRGWGKSHFSFNTKGGRCEDCAGKGFNKIPMSFLPDAVTTCETCGGSRYDEETQEILYQGVSIADVLQMTMDEVREVFRNHKKIKRSLDYVHALGLGYLSLGQPTYTLSGGEAQRLKIAKELGSREAVNTIYILDEPTTGLHMNDVDKLIAVLRRLIDKGNTVILIEHNLDVIRAADYFIELGPGPGDAGGQLVYAGHPAKLRSARNKKSATKPFLIETNHSKSSNGGRPKRKARKGAVSNQPMM